MIPKVLSEIEPQDIDALLADTVSEGRTIDYKLQLPGTSDSDKKEFLADVSSFANTAGGDLVLGVEEQGGVPTAIRGITSSDVDAALQRLDSILLSGLEPRINYRVRRVPHVEGTVVVIRVEQSWIGPHRVVFKGHDKFYARNSAGKYPLDVIELRDAFLRNATAGERIRMFREERLIEIAAGRTPLPLASTGRLVVHVVPLESFTAAKQVDVRTYYDKPNLLRPMSAHGWNWRITASGMLTYTPGASEPLNYTHLYRSGIIEAVDAHVPNRELDGRRIIPTVSLEKGLIEAVRGYLTVLKDLDVAPPVHVLISLLGAKGSLLGVSNAFYDLGERYAIDDEILQLPEAVVDDFDAAVEPILRGPIDVLWNAAGYAGSQNFDAAGNWKPK